MSWFRRTPFQVVQGKGSFFPLGVLLPPFPHSPPPSQILSAIIYRVLPVPGPLLGAGDSENNKVPGTYYNQDTVWERLDEQEN